MFKFIDHMSDRLPSLAIIANGGPTTIREVELSAIRGRPIILLEGTKRSAETILAAINGSNTAELRETIYSSGLLKQDTPLTELDSIIGRLRYIAANAKIHRVPLHSAQGVLTSAMHNILGIKD